MSGINMPKDQKISHLIKGVAEDLYQVLINSEVSTVDKFVMCCHEVDAIRKKRVVALRYKRQPNVTPISTAIEEDPSDLIRRIVKEIEKVFPRTVTTKRTDESSWRPRPRPRQENIPTKQDTGRKTDLWRTSDNVPICFHGGRPGHVTRYCRDRRRIFSAARQRRQLEQYERWDSDSVSDYGRDPESNYQHYRSNSPYPRCNPQRCQSRSPFRRSPVRTSEEN
ncbi:CCHC-type domain-containing protein [Trichonephila inaurata madagascariensis]|uniref:CCHC-type domain-containing protein n=1 Tax=Trichonephila inaurata madagascariensis TaxID=2747483 RepID=A0A8X6XE84_9ARAC|nr:CCHC-type domain-containing protein [Trichonephila inaurata madagascariensis]